MQRLRTVAGLPLQAELAAIARHFGVDHHTAD